MQNNSWIMEKYPMGSKLCIAHPDSGKEEEAEIISYSLKHAHGGGLMIDGIIVLFGDNTRMEVGGDFLSE